MRNKYFFALLLLVLISLVYVTNMSVNLPFGDGTELITVSYINGLAHNPGYPLLTFISNTFLHLPIPIPIIVQANLLSVIFSAISVVLFFLTLITLIEIYFDKLSMKIKITIGLAVSILLGLSYQFWLMASEFEVFALHHFFVSLILYLTFLYHQHAIRKKNNFYLAAGLSLVYGLSLTNHQTIIIFIISSLAYINSLEKLQFNFKKNLSYLLLFILGLSPYLIIFFKISQVQKLNYWLAFEDFGRTLLRSNFGTFSAASFSGQTSTLAVLQLYGQRLVSDSLLIFLLPAMIGLTYVWKRKNLNIFFLILLIQMVFIFSRLNFPVNSSFAMGTLERFFTNFHYLVFLLTAFGLGILANYLAKFRLNKYFMLLILISPFSYFVNKTAINSQTVSASTNLGNYILDNAPPKAIVMPYSDTNYYTLIYLKFVEGKRKDVEIIPFKPYHPTTSVETFSLDNKFLQFIKEHQDREILLVDYPGEFIFKETGKYYEKVPKGIVSIIQKKPTDSNDLVLNEAIKLLKYYQSILPSAKHLPIYSRANSVNAIILSQINWHGVYLIQKEKIKSAAVIYESLIPLIEQINNPSDVTTAEIYKNAGVVYIRIGDTQRGVPYLKKSLEIDPRQAQAKTLEVVIKTYGG